MHGGSNSLNVYPVLFVRLVAAACLTLAGCGGPALLKEVRLLESSAPLAEARDERIAASIETVILCNGPGAWTRNAQWDEYQIRIRALSNEPVEIREIALFDALDHRVEARSNRGELVDGSRETEKRCEQAGELVANRGSSGAVLSLDVMARAMANPVVGLIGIGIALPIIGVAHLVGIEQDNREIQRRRTTFPVALQSGAEASVDLFFPIAPLARRTQVVYVDRHGEHRLDIDTRQAFAELEPPPPMLVSRVDPEYPIHAEWAGIREGSVRARLTLDRQGGVQNVELIESVPSHVFDREARRVLRQWTFNVDRYDARRVDVTLEFKR